jgi:hypothetical protein
MRRQFALVLTLTAWLLATGSQWDVVQTFAWARMFAENYRTLPLRVALNRTFSPEGRCGLCVAVTLAKQSQSDSPDTPSDTPSGKFSGKIVLVLEPAAAPLVPRITSSCRRSRSDQLPVSAERAAPPLPPPRA